MRALCLSLAVLLSLPMLAEQVEINGINYELNADAKQATVIAKSSGYYSGEVIIPESVEHEGTAYSVTSIGDQAFRNCSGLTSVTIPNSVTSIGVFAFSDCSSLTSVTIPNSVTSIGVGAFNYCSGLTSVTIPNSVLSIGMGAFSGCSGLTSVTIPNSVTSIGSYAFVSCSSLTSVTIPNSVTRIEANTFSSCSGLTSVTIPNSVTSIDNAFSNCPELLDVYCYAENVPSTQSNAFDGSYPENATLHVPNAAINSYKSTAPWSGFGNIVAISTEVDGINYDFDADTKQATVIKKSSGYYSGEVVIPESVEHEGTAYSVTSIGEEAFYWCSGLTSVTIGNSVTSIGGNAFIGCDGLTSVHISDIAAWCNIDFGDNPLEYAHHLYLNGEEVKDLVIPNSVTSIGNSAFWGCSGLTSVTIPNSVTSIGDEAFALCSGLSSVTIPNSVESIGSHAFAVCSGLTSVTIPNSVTSIGMGAFYSCSGLTSVTIPNSVTSIEMTTFFKCSGLTSVTIGNGVTSIGFNAFCDCPELIDVYCYAEDVPATNSNAFDGSYPENATLHVPNASINSYKSTAPWSSFGKIVGLSNEFNLTVSSAGYATLFLDFNAEIPAGVQAYTGVKVVGNRLKMERVEGVLPANTGVIIKAEEGTYTFAESDATPATIGDNLLYGTVATTQISTDPTYSYYVLSKVDGIVGMYLAKLTDGKFQNNANKAYMMLKKGDLGIYDEGVDTGTEQLSRGFVFDFGDETSIDELKSEDGKVKSAVYDLSGRRVQKAQKGVYIQNGKVVLVR